MSSEIHKRLYKLGLMTLGYEHKYLTPVYRIIEPFVMVLDGLLDIILLPTPYVSNIHTSLLRRMVKAQCTKRIAKFNKAKENESTKDAKGHIVPTSKNS